MSVTSAQTIHVQRRTVRSLSLAQVLTGVGIAIGVAAGSLLVSEVTGSEDLAGLAQTSGVVGAAFAAVPLAALSARLGRRYGLVVGLWIAAFGAAIVVTGAVLESVVVILPGMLLVGVATAVGLQVRYAASDLASPEHGARDLSIVVWATTIGAVLGPNLMQPAADLAEPTGLPPLAGPYVVTGAALALAAVVVWLMLRPDPLLLARERGGATSAARSHGKLSASLRIIRASPGALFGVSALAVGHCVMVMVMVMTPVHMEHVDVTLTVIGLVISVHILGMYALSPIVGMLSDRLGSKVVIFLGCGILGLATLAAGTAAGDAVLQLGIGLFLLGLGWSCTLIAGSALLTRSVEPADRPAVQGAGDTLMNVAAALGGVVAGVVVSFGSYGWLNVLAGLLVAALVGLGLRFGVSH
jgi:MFS family permease